MFSKILFNNTCLVPTSFSPPVELKINSFLVVCIHIHKSWKHDQHCCFVGDYDIRWYIENNVWNFKIQVNWMLYTCEKNISNSQGTPFKTNHHIWIKIKITRHVYLEYSNHANKISIHNATLLTDIIFPRVHSSTNLTFEIANIIVRIPSDNIIRQKTTILRLSIYPNCSTLYNKQDTSFSDKFLLTSPYISKN